MPKCESKYGFFNLYDCKKNASTHCVTCERPVCATHMHDGANECKECAATGSAGNDNATLTSYRYRHTMFTEEAYEPGYYEGEPGGYYDKYEVAAFEATAASFEDADDNEMDFYDS